MLRVNSLKKITITSAANATVRHLCARHNNMLSPLDAEAARFMRFVVESVDRNTMAAKIDGRTPPELAVFNGDFLERWALKTFMNVSAARDKSDVQKSDRVVKVAGRRIARAVFMGDRLPNGSGLYVVDRAEPRGMLNGTVTFLSADVLEATRTERRSIIIGDEGLVRVPAYMVFNAGPVQFVLYANITELEEPAWESYMESYRQSGNMPRGSIHPPAITLEYHAAQSSLPSMLSMIEIRWPNGTVVGPPAGFVANDWILPPDNEGIQGPQRTRLVRWENVEADEETDLPAGVSYVPSDSGGAQSH